MRRTVDERQRSPAGRYRGAALLGLLRKLNETGGAIADSFSGSVARGFQYDDLPDDLLQEVPGWLRQGVVVDGTEIRPGRAYRRRDWLVKIYGCGHALKDRFRRSAAIRSADWHGRLLPLRTPQPLLAIELRRYGRITAALLVTEFIDGPSLTELWCRPGAADGDAIPAFARFLAEMHRCRVNHGDVHPANFLWDGKEEEWVLIDLDAMRPRKTITRRLIERQWVRMLLILEGEERLRLLFESYLQAAALDWPREAAWQRVHEQFITIRAERARRKPGAS